LGFLARGLLDGSHEMSTDLKEKLAARDFTGVQSRTSAPHARLVHLSVERFPPPCVVPGAALPEDRLTPVFEGFHYSSLSMRSFALRG
jgi:4,5-DOPA dioxygenase extradiol